MFWVVTTNFFLFTIGSKNRDRDLDINDLETSPRNSKSRDVTRLKRQLTKVLNELREEELEPERLGTRSQYIPSRRNLDNTERMVHSTSDLRRDILLDSTSPNPLTKKLAETLNEKEKIRSKYESKKEKYKNVIDKLKRKVKEEQIQSKTLQRELEHSRSKFEQQQQEVDTLRSNMESMYSSLKSDYASKVFDLSQGHKENATITSKLKIDLESTERKLRRKEAEYDRLLEELETKVRNDNAHDSEEAAEAASIFRKMRKAIEERDSQIESLTDEVSTYRKLSQDQLSSINSLRQIESQLYQISSVDASLISQHKQSLDTLFNLAQRIHNDTSLFGSKMSSISKKSSTNEFFDIESLKLKYKSLKRKEENTQESLKNSKNLYQILQQELDNKQQSLLKKQEIIDSLTAESEQKLKLHLSETKQIRAEISDLRIALEQKDIELKALNGTIQVQKEQTQHFQIEAREKSQKVEFLTEKLLEKDQEILNLKKVEKQLKSKYDKSVEHYKQSIEDHQRDTERLKAELSATRDALIESKRQFEIQKNEMVRLKAETLDGLRKQQDNMEELTQKFKAEVKNMRAQHKQEVQNVKKERDSVSRQLNQTLSEITNLNGKILILEDERKSLKDEISILQGEVVSAQRTIESSKKELQLLRENFNSLENEKKEKELVIVTLNQKLEDKHELFEHKVQSLQKLGEQEKANQERKTEMIMNDYKKSLVENEGLTKQISNLEERNNQLNNDNKYLETKVQKKDEQITDHLRKISYLEEANEQQKINLRELLMEKEDLQNRLHYKDMTVKELETKMESLEDERQLTYNQHLKEKDNQVSQIVNLEETLHLRSTEVDQLKSRISQLENNLQYKTMEIDTIASERTSLKNKYEELLANYNMLDNDKLKVDLKLESLSNELNLLTSRYEEATIALEKASRHLTELEEQNLRLQSDLRQVTGERGLLQQRYTEDIETKNQTISQHLTEIEDLENNLRISEERIRKLNSDLQQRDLQNELDTSQRIQMQERLSHNLSSKLDEINDLNSQLLESRHKVAELQDLNQRYQVEMIQVQKAARTSKQKVQTFVRQLKLQIRTLSYSMNEIKIVAENEIRSLKSDIESKTQIITHHLKLGVSNPELVAELEDLKSRLQHINDERRNDIELHRKKLKMLNDQIAELRQSLSEKTQECQRLEEIFQNNLVKDIKTLSNSVNLSDDLNF